MNRRSFLQFGLGGMLLTGLGGALLSRRAQAKTPAQGGKAKSCILLYMEGGPSQIDTFDPKPGRPTGGEFAAIGTAVAGIQISEHLPKIAASMKEIALIRSLTSKEGNHNRARHLMHTGYAPGGAVDHPCFGSIVAEARGQSELPGYVAIGGPGADSGFMSAALSPFPVLDPTKPVRNLSYAKGVSEERFDRRLGLWRTLQGNFQKERPSTYIEGQKQVGEQAVLMMRSPKAEAFVLDKEPQKIREMYGETKFGLGCLMARRLVEAQCPFVEVTLRGWDTHKENFKRVKELSASLDQGMSALLQDLSSRGLLESTLVVWAGDFGRTPRINENGGRDHHPACSSVLLAGGGVKGGQLIGETDEDGREIASRPVTVPDLFRSVAFAMGIDPDESRYSPSGRPLKNVDGGEVIAELF